MLRLGCAAVCLLSLGCDQVFGLSRGDDPPVDAATFDAVNPEHACRGRTPPPMFCADFDEANQIAFAGGFEVSLPSTANGATFGRRPPSTTGANGMWITSTGGAVTMGATSPATAATKLVATFALRIAATKVGNGTTGLFVLSLPGAANPCFVGVEIDEDNEILQMQGHCGPNDSNPHQTITPGLPAPGSWVALRFAFDITTGIATASVDGGADIEMPFGVTSTIPTTPSVRFGIDLKNHAGLQVGFDDITVTAE